MVKPRVMGISHDERGRREELCRVNVKKKKTVFDSVCLQN